MARSSTRGSHRTGGTVSFAHWWESGDGAESLTGLREGFERRAPGVDVETIQLANLSMQVKSDILREQPPDAWTEWPGASMIPYRQSDALADLSGLWRETGLAANCRDGPERAARDGDAYYTVPLNIHRINNLFYDPRSLEAAAVDPTQITDPEEFLEALDQIAEHEDTPLLVPLKNPWMALQLWETILLGQTGAHTYEQIVGGDARTYESDVRDALALLKAYTEYSSDDALFTSLTDASGRFQRGASPLYPQGDWVAAGFTDAESFQFGTEWECIPFPGTENAYSVVMDGLMVSNGAIEDDAVRQFARYVASRDAQRRFNVRKGSLPPRTDVSTEGFSPFLKRQRRDLGRVRDQPLSLTHGLAVEPVDLMEIKSEMATFLSQWNAADSARRIVSILD